MQEHDINETKDKLISIGRAAAFAAWFTGIIIVGLLTSNDHASFFRGVIITTMTLGLPALAIAAYRKLVAGVSLLRHRNEDDAVSPVIAVILMVAITVVLAAVVYVWVGNFGTSSNTAPGSLSVISNGHEGANWSFIISSASNSLKWDDINVAGMSYGNTTAHWSASRNGTILEPTQNVVQAGDIITFYDLPPTGKQIVMTQRSANVVLLQMMVGNVVR